MILCKKCGCENPAYEPVCNECAAEFSPTEQECEGLLADAARAMENRDYRQAVDIYRFLAGRGVTEGEREFGLILEKGILLPKDTELASRYFYSAARKGDGEAAYRYSRLLSRLNPTVGEFWLEYAAIMDNANAFAEASRLYTARGDEQTAAYYCARLALLGETDALVEMAQRHLEGRGVNQNECYAKWYLGRLERIPLYARGLSRKLGIVDREYKPPIPRFENRTVVLKSLIARAKKYEMRRVLLSLSDLFARSDSKDSGVELAYLYIEGIEFEQNIELGINLLKQAVESGSASGAKYLGDLYAEGKYAEADYPRAVKYYRQAASLGADGAHEALGDVFSMGALTPPEYGLAMELYRKGEELGDLACGRKLRKILEQRERSYLRGCEIEKTKPEEAFSHFKRSVDQGYSSAHAKIAPYYEKGIGVEKNRKIAFAHYKAAADAGDDRAYEGLGRCYARGIGTKFDFNLAVKYLTLAKDLDSRAADKELIRIYENKRRNMLKSLYSTAIRLYYQKKPEKAREMIETCADLGMPKAIYTMGCLTEFGITLPPSRQTALKFYTRAASLGYKDHRGAHKQWLLRLSK